MLVGIEPLFGKCGDVKLIVSVSLGNFALFRSSCRSCPSDYVPLGQTTCFLLLLRLRTGMECCLPTCAQGSSVSVMGNAVFFFGFLVSSWCLVHMGSSGLSRLPVVYKTWVTQVCFLLDTPFGRRSVGALPL